MGETEGWKRCPACHQLIELAHGCYHMTCRCRKEFCYLCAETWKNCACTQWDEHRLVEAAEDRARRQLPPAGRAAAPPPAVFQNLVRRQVENLRVNHECAHRRWAYRSGGGTCETCAHYLPMFLLVRRCGFFHGRMRFQFMLSSNAPTATSWLALDAEGIGCEAVSPSFLDRTFVVLCAYHKK
jgi:hypothetical protein